MSTDLFKRVNTNELFEITSDKLKKREEDINDKILSLSIPYLTSNNTNKNKTNEINNNVINCSYNKKIYIFVIILLCISLIVVIVIYLLEKDYINKLKIKK